MIEAAVRKDQALNYIKTKSIEILEELNCYIEELSTKGRFQCEYSSPVLSTSSIAEEVCLRLVDYGYDVVAHGTVLNISWE